MNLRSMRAAVLSGPRRLDVVEIPIPDCGPDDVLIQVEGVGLCGSDVTMYDGHCAEFAVVPAAFTWPLPDTVSVEDAVCIEPLAVALAAIREGRPQPGDRVTVFGAGSQGLLLTLALKARGVAPDVVDPQTQRL